jgi:hypothetical protein
MLWDCRCVRRLSSRWIVLICNLPAMVEDICSLWDHHNLLVSGQFPAFRSNDSVACRESLNDAAFAASTSLAITNAFINKDILFQLRDPVMITSLNGRSHTPTCLLRLLTLAYTHTCTRFLNLDAVSAPTCCLRVRQARHITSHPTLSRMWLRLWPLFTFNIYIRSFPFIVPQLATLCYELLLCSLLTVPTESTLSLASAAYRS